jgi:hypothetical protein
LKIGENGNVKIPNYRLTDVLGKIQLYNLIRKKEHLNVYLPSETNGDEVNREFLLSVSLLKI